MCCQCCRLVTLFDNYISFSNYQSLINLLLSMGLSLSAPILDDYRQFSKARILNNMRAMSVDSKNVTRALNKANHPRLNISSGGKVTERKKSAKERQEDQNVCLPSTQRVQNIIGFQSQSNSPIKLKKLQNKQHMFKNQRNAYNHSLLDSNKKTYQSQEISARNLNKQSICQQKKTSLGVSITHRIEPTAFTAYQDEFQTSPRPQTTDQNIISSPKEFKRSAKYILPKLKVKHMRKYSNLQNLHQEVRTDHSLAQQDESTVQIKTSEQFQCKIKNNHMNLMKARCHLTQKGRQQSSQATKLQVNLETLIRHQKLKRYQESYRHSLNK